MVITTADLIGWVSGVLLSAVLLCCLILKKRWREEPCFTSWIALNCLSGTLLFLTYRILNPEMYGFAYAAFAALDFGLQLALIVEIAAKVLKRRGAWVNGADKHLGRLSSLSFVLSLALATFIDPAASTTVDRVFARCNLFMTTLFCFLFLSLITVSKGRGLMWSKSVLTVSYGLLCWNLGSFVTDTLHCYWPAAAHFSVVEFLRTVAFQATMLYWVLANIRRGRSQKAGAHDRDPHMDLQVAHDLSHIEYLS